MQQAANGNRTAGCQMDTLAGEVQPHQPSKVGSEVGSSRSTQNRRASPTWVPVSHPGVQDSVMLYE
jgi:hypothetical protein